MNKDGSLLERLLRYAYVLKRRESRRTVFSDVDFITSEWVDMQTKDQFQQQFKE